MRESINTTALRRASTKFILLKGSKRVRVVERGERNAKGVNKKLSKRESLNKQREVTSKTFARAAA